MTGKQRVYNAMHHKEVDRIPVFCQLSLGHYMTHTPYEPYTIWYSPTIFVDSLIMLAKRYRFDGILVNLPGRCPDWENHIIKKERHEHSTIIHWDDGSYSVCPDDDNVHHFSQKPLPSFDEVDPDLLYYIEPHDITGVNYPYSYGFEKRPFIRGKAFFPEYILDTCKYAVNRAGKQLHVSSEIFSPFTQLMELFGYTDALISLIDNPKKCERILENLSEGAATWALLQSTTGVDAILVSSAFAGGGFISRDHYSRFVLPYEKYIVTTIHKYSTLPIYVHTCGSIGDRIDLMVKAGYDGIDTMDPPPLGNTDIAEIKQEFGDLIFLKGNLDPVNVLLKKSKDEVYQNACHLIEVAGEKSGYILSTACSIAPHANPENIMMLSRASIDTTIR